MKMELGDTFLKLCFLILFHQSDFCNGQLATALIREMRGLTNTYPNQGFVTKPTCKHAKMRPLLTFSDPVKPTSCLREIVQKGGIPQNVDQYKRTDEIIRDHGYYLKTYTLTSPDGYIQTLFRITGSPKSPPRGGKPAVLLAHGQTTSSVSYLLIGERSLPFRLANAGYEVWLMNLRGTDYSMGHVKYNSNWNLEYWNFSFHEVAVYDIPMIIDFMLAKTETQKVFFVGHSFGAFLYPIAVAEKPELNDKIHASFAFGGGGPSFHLTNPGLKVAAVLLDLEPSMLNLLGFVLRGRITLGAPILKNIASSFCMATPMTCRLCGTLATIVMGHSEPQFNYTDIPYYVAQAPNTVGLKVLIHIGQTYRNCELHKFDYGPQKNLQVYGNSAPPLYNLNNVRAPVHIYYGEGDDMVTLEDVNGYVNALPPGTVRGLYKIPWKPFNHFDFFIGQNVDTIIYDKLLEDFKLYV